MLLRYFHPDSLPTKRASRFANWEWSDLSKKVMDWADTFLELAKKMLPPLESQLHDTAPLKLLDDVQSSEERVLDGSKEPPIREIRFRVDRTLFQR